MRKCSTNRLGHGHGYECHSQVVRAHRAEARGEAGALRRQWQLRGSEHQHGPPQLRLLHVHRLFKNTVYLLLIRYCEQLLVDMYKFTVFLSIYLSNYVCVSLSLYTYTYIYIYIYTCRVGPPQRAVHRPPAELQPAGIMIPKIISTTIYTYIYIYICRERER